MIAAYFTGKCTVICYPTFFLFCSPLFFAGIFKAFCTEKLADTQKIKCEMHCFFSPLFFVPFSPQTLADTFVLCCYSEFRVYISIYITVICQRGFSPLTIPRNRLCRLSIESIYLRENTQPKRKDDAGIINL